MESPFWQATGLVRIVGLLLSGICHQLPEHSLFLAGVQMPLCARCTGTFLGAALTLVNLWLQGRSGAGRLPPVRVLAVLGLFFAFWAIDGLNSYWHFVTGHVFLYAPTNSLRLAAGLVNGAALSVLILTFFNNTLWQAPQDKPVVEGLCQLSALLLPAAILGALLQANVGVLLYPVLLGDVLSVLLLLSPVNSMIVVIGLRRENRTDRWREATLPLLSGLALSIAELVGMALLRSAVWDVLLLASR